jgi:hypothetical protein
MSSGDLKFSISDLEDNLDDLEYGFAGNGRSSCGGGSSSSSNGFDVDLDTRVIDQDQQQQQQEANLTDDDIFRSKSISGLSKTPYSDATQVSR